MGKHPELTFSAITERDTDLLLVEELKCSEEFRTWFLNLVAVAQGVPRPEPTSNCVVWHSVSSSTGESDIRFDFTAGQVRRAVLIENKIDSPFQPNQPERYSQRARHLVSKDGIGEVTTVVVAPQDYLNSTSGCEAFDARISYEELRDYCASRAQEMNETGARFAHRRDILEQAIEKSRRREPAEPDAAVTDFWRAYFRLAERIAARLGMQRPGKKPANSTWVTFARALVREEGLPHVELVHKWPVAKVDIHLYGMAKHAALLSSVLEPLLGPDMTLRKATKSLAVSVRVPALNPKEPFDRQREAAEQGLLAALRLQKWYQDYWAKLRDRISSALRKSAGT